MDLACIIELIVSLQHLLSSIRGIGKDIFNAKDDLRKLANELSSLKASLGHVHLIYALAITEKMVEMHRLYSNLKTRLLLDRKQCYN